MGERVRFGVFECGRAVGVGADGGEGTHVDQAYGAARNGAPQIFGRACVAGVIIPGGESFGHAGKMDYGIDTL
jgi:hypothetical protein